MLDVLAVGGGVFVLMAYQPSWAISVPKPYLLKNSAVGLNSPNVKVFQLHMILSFDH